MGDLFNNVWTENEYRCTSRGTHGALIKRTSQKLDHTTNSSAFNFHSCAC
jgi:hypothetical protein